MSLRRLLLTFGGWLCASSALAVPAPLSSGVASAVESAATYTLDQIIGGVGRSASGEIAVGSSSAGSVGQVASGSVLRYAGTAFIASSLTAAALTWAYRGLQKQATGTDLDWWADPAQVRGNIYQVDLFISSPNYYFTDAGGSNEKTHYQFDITEKLYYDGGQQTQSLIPQIVRLTIPGIWDRWWTIPCSTLKSAFVASAYLALRYPGYNVVADDCNLGGTAYRPGPAEIASPDLVQFIQDHPSAREGVRTILSDYIKQIADITDDPTKVILTPAPNANQKCDCVEDRTLDTDGDGIKDYDEVVTFHTDPNDPASKPDLNSDPMADPDGDGFITAEEIAAGTNPHDPNSRPNQHPPLISDADGDGFTYYEEIAAGTNPFDPSSKPDAHEPNLDQDGDGFTKMQEDMAGTSDLDPVSKPLPSDDTDGDGFTNQQEADAGTDPFDPASKPDPEADPNANPDGTCKSGYSKDASGKCQPVQQPDCDNDPSTEKPDCEPETPNNAGDCIQTNLGSGIGGLVQNFWPNTEKTLKCLFVPRDPIDMSSVVNKMKTKFPFSLADRLNVTYDFGTGESEPVMPTKLGMIDLDMGFFSPLWQTIKGLIGVFIWVAFIRWLVDRFTPQAQM